MLLSWYTSITGVLSQEQQERLQALYEQTNPLLLREEIYASLAVLWDGALTPAPLSNIFI